jgi:gliding motility-associated-like protein
VYAAGGTYTVTLVVVTKSGAIDSVKHAILINPSPVASYTFLSTCALDSVYFTNTSSITGGTITTWNWNFGDGDVSSLQNPVHYYDSTAAYVVTLTATSDSGCTSAFTDSVMYAKDVIAGFSHATDCQFNALFNDTSLLASSDSVASWNWNFGDGNSDTIENPLHTYTAPGTYTVQLIVISSGGCTDTISNTVSIIASPLADFIPAGGSYYQGESINFTDLSNNAASWVWNFGDGSSDTVQNPSHTYDQNGILDVMLIVMNINGCPDTANYSFTIYPNIVGVPTAFTPNGDNVNDVLHVMGGPMKEMDWRIYNEWGNEVFHATDQSMGWDATYKGKAQPATRYVYTLTGTTISGDAIELTGEVTIMR